MRIMKNGSPRAPTRCKRGQPVRDLLEPRPEPALQQLEIIARRLARAQEAGIGHHHRRGEIAGEMAAEQPLGGAVGEARALGQRVDLRPRLDLRRAG